MLNKHPLFRLQERKTPEQVQYIYFLLFDRQISDEEAQKVLEQFNAYLNKDYISLLSFIHARYGLPKF